MLILRQLFNIGILLLISTGPETNERFSYLPKVTKLIGGRKGTITHIYC